MKKALAILTFLCFSLIVVAMRDCERGIENKYCTDPKLVWTEHHDGKCYKARCKNGMEICRQVSCEGLVSRSFTDSLEGRDEAVTQPTNEKKKKKKKKK